MHIFNVNYGLSMSYLHRVIVEISYDDFILVVHCNKVRTYRERETS